MNAAALLATVALLLVPVGVNGLLRQAGRHAGVTRTLPLLGAGWLAYCLAIGTWCTALGLLALAAPAARPGAQVVAAAYLVWRVLARRQPPVGVGAWSLFPAALADPMALCCAAFAFPALGTPAPAVLAAYGWFTALMLPAGLAWIAAGAGVLPRRWSPRSGALHRVALRRPWRRMVLLAAGVARAR